MIPLQKIFDWGGEKLGDYLGKDLKDLLVITLSKYVFTVSNSCHVSMAMHSPFRSSAIEAALAIILLLKCQ